MSRRITECLDPRICLTGNFEEVRTRLKEWEEEYSGWDLEITRTWLCEDSEPRYQLYGSRNETEDEHKEREAQARRHLEQKRNEELRILEELKKKYESNTNI